MADEKAIQDDECQKTEKKEISQARANSHKFPKNLFTSTFKEIIEPASSKSQSNNLPGKDFPNVVSVYTSMLDIDEIKEKYGSTIKRMLADATLYENTYFPSYEYCMSQLERQFFMVIANELEDTVKLKLMKPENEGKFMDLFAQINDLLIRRWIPDKSQERSPNSSSKKLKSERSLKQDGSLEDSSAFCDTLRKQKRSRSKSPRRRSRDKSRSKTNRLQSRNRSRSVGRDESVVCISDDEEHLYWPFHDDEFKNELKRIIERRDKLAKEIEDYCGPTSCQNLQDNEKEIQKECNGVASDHNKHTQQPFSIQNNIDRSHYDSMDVIDMDIESTEEEPEPDQRVSSDEFDLLLHSLRSITCWDLDLLSHVHRFY